MAGDLMSSITPEALETDQKPLPGGKQALEILRTADELRLATLRVGEKRKIAAAFATHGLPVYGQAFDAVSTHRLPGDGVLDFKDPEQLQQQAKLLTLIEIKATRRPSIPPDFAGFFFAITTSELLAAQKLGEQYRFALVNLTTRRFRLYSLGDLMKRTKAIYPSWSVLLGPA